MKRQVTHSVIAVLVLAMSLTLACGAKSTIQRAVDLVPAATSLINAFETALGTEPTPLKAVLENVKKGLTAFEIVAKDYLAAPSATGLAGVVKAVDAFVANFDAIWPNLPDRYKVVATAADLMLHLIEEVVHSAQPAPTVTAKARVAALPAHVDRAVLRDLARKQGLGKYVK